MSEPAFTCPRCGRTSYNPSDAAHRYCGACHTFYPEETMPTIDEIERDMTIQLLTERVLENANLARSAVQMVAVLVNKMGGEVEITPGDVEAAVQYDLAQIARVEDGVMILRVERRRPN
jgi:hypothetical protein